MRMRRLTPFLAAMALAQPVLAGETTAPSSPPGEAEVRKHLADFFLRTKGMSRVVSASEVWEGIRSGKSAYRVVDVRGPEEFERGHLPGAINIPLDVLFRPASLERLPPDGGPILLVCQSGHVESMALGGLVALGYEPWVLRFGMIGWNAETGVRAGGSLGPEVVVRGLGGPIER